MLENEMMNQCRISLMPDESYLAACEESGNLFHAPDWLNVFKIAFNSNNVFIWNPGKKDGFSLTVMKAGPFRVGYIGYPVGGTIRDPAVDQSVCSNVLNEKLPLRIDAIRISQSAFPNLHPLPFNGIETPETAILDLNDWPIGKLSGSIHRNLKKAAKNEVRIVDAAAIKGEKTANEIYELYCGVISRHNGAYRYNREYFYEILQLARRNQKIKCSVAKIRDKTIAFLVVAISGQAGFYLHGGTDYNYQQYRPGDYLMHDAILQAKKQGLQYFNMLSSPPRQKTLVQYKEKWGGVTRGHMTYELARNPMATWLFKRAASLYDNLNRLRNKKK